MVEKGHNFFFIFLAAKDYSSAKVCLNLPGETFLPTSYATPVLCSHEVLIASNIGMVIGLLLP